MKLFCWNWHIVIKAHMFLNIIFATKGEIATLRAWCKLLHVNSLIGCNSTIPKCHNGSERQSFLCDLLGVVQKRRIILDFLGQFGINN
jgi:hypothetical protein